MLPLTVMLSLIAPAAGALADRFGHRPLILAGVALETAGMALLAWAAAARLGYPALIAPMAMIGSGASLAMPALQTAPVSAVPPAAIGKASGTFTTMRQLGTTFGVAIGSAAFAAAGGYSSAAAFSRGFAAATAASAGMLAVAVIIAIAIPRRPASEPEGAALPGLRSEATKEGSTSKRPQVSEPIVSTTS
jgi:MFS family permease